MAWRAKCTRGYPTSLPQAKFWRSAEGWQGATDNVPLQNHYREVRIIIWHSQLSLWWCSSGRFCQWHQAMWCFVFVEMSVENPICHLQLWWIRRNVQQILSDAGTLHCKMIHCVWLSQDIATSRVLFTQIQISVWTTAGQGMAPPLCPVHCSWSWLAPWCCAEGPGLKHTPQK